VSMPTVAQDRRGFLGGSDIAAVLGISPWRTPLQLWERKVSTEPPEERPARAVLTRGHRWESVVAEMLVERLKSQGHDVEIVASNKRYIDPDRPYLSAEIDYEIRLDGEDMITNVELKTVHPFKASEWGEPGSDEAPVWYVAQGMHGLGVTPGERQRCIIAALFGADELQTFTVRRDDDTIAGMRARCAAFWNLVQTGTRPEPSNLADLDRIYRGDQPEASLIADEQLERQYLRLRAIQQEIKAREAEFEALEFDVKLAMKDATTLLVGERAAINWKSRDHSWLDQQALKEQEPKIHRALMRKAKTRVFTVK